MNAPLPDNEVERLEFLRDLGILDTPPESAFDDITRLAALIFQTPIALIALVDEKRQWFKSYHGSPGTLVVERQLAFCAHTILEKEALLVPDALQDPRFAAHPQVIGAPHLRFYAGVPLRTAEGFALGSLAVLDFVPRELSSEQMEGLRALGRQVMSQLQLRRHLSDKTRMLGQDRVLQSAIMLSALDCIIAMDNAGRVVQFNPAAEQTFGYTREEAVGRELSDLIIPPPLREAHRRGLAKYISGAAPKVLNRRLEMPAVRKNGRELLVELTVVRAGDAIPPLFIGFLRDITESKRAAAALQESQERFFKLFRASPAPIAINTVDEGRFIDANDRYCELFGYTRSELIGRTVTEVGLWANPADRIKMLEPLQSEGKVRALEVVFRSKSGELHDLLLSIEVSHVPGEAEAVLVAMFTDITERKRLEEKLRQAQRMESIGRLAGGVAHDFNNILMVIQGHASLLRMGDPPLSEEVNDAVGQISQAADRAADLTRQLLAFSRKQVIQAVDLDFDDVLRKMTKMLHRVLGADITLQVEFSSTIPQVHADPGMMEQVVLNLAVNARDAMPKGGTLILKTSIEAVDDEMARQNAEARAGSFVILTVTDTGCGIARESLPRIFEPFFTTKEIGKGTGLGLATVYGIVKQHHGWIKVYSELSRGTSFRVYLPASLGQLPLPREIQTPAVQGGHETILVVEDEPEVRRLARRVLEQHGYTVLEAEDGKVALALWRQHKEEIALVFTDMVMPGGVSGMDLAAQLLMEKATTKFIFSSGYSVDVFGQELVLREGMEFLQKPYPPVRLAEAVRKCLDGA